MCHNHLESMLRQGTFSCDGSLALAMTHPHDSPCYVDGDGAFPVVNLNLR